MYSWQILLAGIENFFLFNTALSVMAFVLVYLIERYGWLTSRRPDSRARIYILALVAPPVVSIWLVCAAMLPAFWLNNTTWVKEHTEAHSLHLLNAFTVIADPMLGYVSMVFMLTALVVATLATGRTYLRLNRLIECLEIGAKLASSKNVEVAEAFCSKRGIAVGLIVSDYPFSFVWGYLKSKLIVSTGLLNSLSQKELLAVLEHETAHYERRDNLLKSVLTICRYANPAFPLTSMLYRRINEQVEMICDEIAVRRMVLPVDLASALVHIKRLTTSVGQPVLQMSASNFLDDERSNFERRVLHTLSLTNVQGEFGTTFLSRSCLRNILGGGALFIISLGTLFLISPLAVHRIIELFLQALPG